jgi:hypothetical protein
MKKFIYILILVFAIGWGCDDEAFLNREPQNILLEDQVWSSNTTALSVLADLYFRLPEFQSTGNYYPFADFDEALYQLQEIIGAISGPIMVLETGACGTMVTCAK